MLQDVHTRKINTPVTAPIGDTIIIPFTANEWHYIHELIGDLQVAGDLDVVAIAQDSTERVLANFTLTDGQGITLSDESGEDNRPRFEFKPGENAVLRVTGGDFIGNVHWSKRL